MKQYPESPKGNKAESVKTNPRRDLILSLAEIRLQNHPVLLKRIRSHLESETATGVRLMDAIHPGEIPVAQSIGGMSAIKERILRSIDAWANDQPETQTQVRPFVANAEHSNKAVTLAGVDQVQPEMEGLPTTQPTVQKNGIPSVGKVTTNSTRTKKTHYLATSIKKAQENLDDKLDTTAVWANMQGLAAKKFSNLIGCTEDGIQYLKDGVVKYFTRDALDKHLHPEKRGTPGKRRAPPA